jgi:hypothetical protein
MSVDYGRSGNSVSALKSESRENTGLDPTSIASEPPHGAEIQLSRSRRIPGIRQQPKHKMLVDEQIHQNPHDLKDQQTLQGLAAEIERLKDENRQIREKWMTAVHEINSLRAEKDHSRDDGYFIEEWKRLAYTIKNWSLSYFEGSPGRSLWSWTTHSYLKRLTQDYKACLKSDYLRPLIVQSYIWDQLRIRVFTTESNSGGLLWAASPDRETIAALRELQQRLNPGMIFVSNSLIQTSLSLLHQKSSQTLRQV